MRFLTAISLDSAFLLLVAIIPLSLAGYRPGHPQLRHEERRTIENPSFFGSLGSLFRKRDDCGTQFGPTYVDCGYDGCFQPSLGEVCCGSESDYCYAGQYCSGKNCCPNGLDYTCCDTGENCPANVSSYYTTASSTTPPPASTSLPVTVSTSSKVSTTTIKKTSTSAITSTSTVVAGTGTNSKGSVVTTSTTGGTSSLSTGGGVSTSVAGSGAQEMRMRTGIEVVAMGALGVVGFVAGLI